MATLLLALCFLIFTTPASQTQSEANVQLVPALYVFGDSTIDGGNFHVPFPYGVDLTGPLRGTPNRCCNGQTVADFIATFLGLPIVPPSTNVTQAGTSTNGVNFGYAGTGILKETGTVDWAFADQINKFNSTVANNLAKMFDEPRLTQHLKDSIFLVSFGINDYNVNLFFPTNSTLSTLSPDVFSQFLLNELTNRLKTLYSFGARKFFVNNIWPLGCSPMFMLNLPAPLINCCNETVNQIVLPYSNALPLVLDKLESSLPGSFFSYSDNFKFVRELKENVGNYGITNTTGKCLSGWFNGTLCENRDEYLYFDPLHTTEAANRIFALECFNGTLCGPKNIFHLAAA
ncbi:GDSL esterase/lipase 7-like [Rhododendron vialii]|uniref:GDSL esterase/lipase 7-like n=1 Tax=Rhododendron vialii TaxID=182163 RepID=UPI00265E0425|nr:GDSL esterase/lipase 7-like [Rhododendron vialii]